VSQHQRLARGALATCPETCETSGTAYTRDTIAQASRTFCDILAKHVVILRKAYQDGASTKGVRKVRCKASGDQEETWRKPLSSDHR
jgi:hypothetical protein